MFTILLHSSKTMRSPQGTLRVNQQPTLLQAANSLAEYMKTLSIEQVGSSMQLSPVMATKTKQLINTWSDTPAEQLPAIDCFLGDIYSGFQTQTLSDADRAYANDHLFILSGLYGILRACDSIHPYRLEMGYKLPDEPYRNLYSFWGDRLAKVLPASEVIVNLSAVEYTKAILPYLKDRQIITPKFMTLDQKTQTPKFVTVHAKIARGAFARWLIQNRIDTIDALLNFTELGYQFDPALSTPDSPVFVCHEFKGIGLSVRLS